MPFSTSKRLELRKMERATDNRLQFGKVAISWLGQAKDSVGFSQDNKTDLDIDLAAFLMSNEGNVIEIVSSSKQQSDCRGMLWGGDSHEKNEDGGITHTLENGVRQEFIDFDLGIISNKVDYIVFAALLQNERDFSDVKEMTVTLTNTANHRIIKSITLKELESYPAIALLSLAYLHGQRDWDCLLHQEYAIAGSFSLMRTAAQNAMFLHKYILND